MGWSGERSAQGRDSEQWEEPLCYQGIFPREGNYNHSACQSPRREITNASAGFLVTYPRGTDSSQNLDANSKKIALPERLFPAIPEVHPFLQITWACSAPKTRIQDRFASIEIRSTLLVNHIEIPTLCSGEIVH